GVFRANATIRLLNLVVAEKPTEISLADQNGIRGEALFLRAHYHFEAYRMWGHIPYYTEADSEPVAQGGYRKANDLPLAQIIGNIIADLNQAITLLPAKPRNGDKGRVTKWAAMAYKGRVQVYGAGLPVALSNTSWNTTAALSDTNFSGGQLAAVDPRLDWTVGRDKVPYKDWTLHSRSWIRDATYSGPYSPKKNVHEKAADAENNVGWQATQTNDVNIHIYRFADLLLLNAEAHVHATTGVLDSARVLINLVRARAGKVAQGCGNPSDSLVKAG